MTSFGLKTGRAVSVDVAERHVRKLKDQIDDLKRECQMYRERVRGRPPLEDPVTELPPRPLGTGEAPPPRPPKSAELKEKLKKKPIKLERSTSDGGALRSSPVTKRANDPGDDDDGDDYESISDGDEDGYLKPK